MSTWNISWLTSAPPNVVRGVVSTLLNIIRAEGESPEEAVVGVTGNISRSFFSTAGGIGPALGAGLPGLAAAQPFALDQSRVTQLVDMGFPRRAAETILTRCRNNLSIATEYLLSHPDVVGAARIAEAAQAEAALLAPPVPVVEPVIEPVVEAVVEPVVVPAAEAEVVAPEPNLVEATTDVLMENATGVVEAPKEDELTLETAVAKLEEAVQELRKSLSATREPLKQDFLERALTIAQEFPDVIFEIKGAFNLLGPGEDDSSQHNLDSIVNYLDQQFDSILSTKPAAVAIRFRLVALLASDAVYREAIESTRERMMSVLVRCAQVYLATPSTKEARPLWLASSMLLADSLFSVAEVPVPTTILAADAILPEEVLVCQGPAWESERDAYLKVAIDVLAKGVCTREVFLSTVRLLLVLTRDHGRAATFVEQDGLRALFSSLSTERPETQGCRPYAIMILRHVIESKEILQPSMEREIESWFAAPRAPVGDITGFLRGVGSIAFRNVSTFLDATKATCKIVRPDATTHYHLTLINHPAPISKNAESETAIASTFAGDGTSAPVVEMQVEEPVIKSSIKALPTDPSVETVIHFLMAEIMETTKISSTPTVATVPIETPVILAVSEVVAAVAPVKKDDAELITEQFHSVFTMSCLAELISSYSICKSSFFSFSKKSAKESTSTKLRSSFLTHLLNEVIPIPINIASPADADTKKRVQLSQWASLIVVSLCFDAEAAPSSKESSTDLTNIRKVVLDAISKAYKDAATSIESTELRYGRIFSLSDLCSRILTCRPFQTGVKTAGDDTSMQIAKLMLEKNYAVILTNALADVDLNYPSVHNLINSILRPLEQLTKVVTKVGRAKPSVPALGLSDDDSSSFDEGEEQEVDTEEEEAPDLYRNSALGMYEGELEPGHMEDAYMSGDSAEDYDEDDEDMEDIEDGLPGSDVSDVSVDVSRSSIRSE